ncbi:CheR family methyltransferase [Oxynema aestuarii]|uniref:protein-glutamate O-methyltransferase n=1 Tax=Oxynema aestuarii AP17 TaxID=2064643 RepID=A0A6H1TZ76_9CYAN|nr:protein-glutamate O-methyltransferase CheR [Oxynema aestuarii]QIZ71220.1 tetratricopeptide repeat protein [Oxynema aestuarii AP17]
MTVDFIERFVRLIADYTGLQIRPSEYPHLSKKLETRINACKQPSTQDYYQLLEAATKTGSGRGDRDSFEGRSLLTTGDRQIDLSRQEWKELIELLTTGETYFFRDKGQFWLLENIIFPELIQKRKQAHLNGQSYRPSLRVWSAGSSSGEEAYSIAIVLKELIGDLNDWDLFILGTDLNAEAIAKAQKGVYSPWSFRSMDPRYLSTYFHKRGDRWAIDPSVRQLVTFRQGNLLADPFPNPGSDLYDFDLIICRNVFVYFEPSAIAATVNKFSQTLRSGGYLIVAHAELHGQPLPGLNSKIFPQSVVYQRGVRPASTLPTPQAFKRSASQRSAQFTRPPAPPLTGVRANANPHTPNELSLDRARDPLSDPSPSSLPIAVPQTFSSPSPKAQWVAPQPPADLTLKPEAIDLLFAEAQTLFERKAYGDALKQAERILKLNPRYFEAHCLIARIAANLGHYSRAEAAAQKASDLNPLSVEPYYLLAHIAEEKGDLDRAKYWFDRIIYLDNSCIYAYLELASIYEMQKNFARAKKLRLIALNIVKRLHPDTPVKRRDPLTARDLLLYLENLVGREAQ